MDTELVKSGVKILVGLTVMVAGATLIKKGTENLNRYREIERYDNNY